MTEHALIPGVVDPWATEAETSRLGSKKVQPSVTSSYARELAELHEFFAHALEDAQGLEKWTDLEASRHSSLIFPMLEPTSLIEVHGVESRSVVRARPPEWRVAAASAIAGGAAAVGLVLTALTALGSGFEVNPYIAGSLAIGGLVLVVTLIVALREQ